MADTAPTLTIEVSRGPGPAFNFTDQRGNHIAVGSSESLNQALFEQSMLRNRLEKLKKVADGALDHRGKADSAIGQLYELGQLLYSNLVGDDDQTAPALDRLVRAALSRGRAGGEIPRVHVTTANNDPIAHAIPFEFLSFHEGGRPRPIDDDDGRLSEALDGFLGLSTIVVRGKGDAFAGSFLSRQNGRIPVTLFQNVDLRSVAAEMKFLGGRRELAAAGPWPDAGLDSPTFSSALLNLIFYPERDLKGGPRAVPDQIQHFACHCETFDGPDEHRFILAGEPKTPLAMTLGQLRATLTDLARRELRATCEMPLVFLNGCGSAVVDPRTVGSFVSFFLRNGNRGFIGALTMIPDATASEFAQTFYRELFRCADVAEALYGARRRLAERYSNLLGLLYMYYGPAELRVMAA